VSFGRQNNNLYDQVINGVKAKAETGAITWENINGLAPTDPIYATVLSNMPITSDLSGLAGEELKGKLVKVNIPGVGETLARFEGRWDNHTNIKGTGTKDAGYAYLLHDGRYVKQYIQGNVLVDNQRVN
jgi:hypothetical protein